MDLGLWVFGDPQILWIWVSGPSDPLDLGSWDPQILWIWDLTTLRSYGSGVWMTYLGPLRSWDLGCPGRLTGMWDPVDPTQPWWSWGRVACVILRLLWNLRIDHRSCGSGSVGVWGPSDPLDLGVRTLRSSGSGIPRPSDLKIWGLELVWVIST